MYGVHEIKKKENDTKKVYGGEKLKKSCQNQSCREWNIKHFGTLHSSQIVFIGEKNCEK